MTHDEAADLGFKLADHEQMQAIFKAMAIDDEEWEVMAMDLARFCNVHLVDAAWALADGSVGKYRRLRALGFPDERIGIEVKGQAAAYAKTFYGQLDVREAHGWTLSALATRLVETMFGRRNP